MTDRLSAISPESLRHPGEVALLTVIDAVLDVPVGELPDRVTLVRRYIEVALDPVHDNRPDNRRIAFLVIAQMLVRDASQEPGRRIRP